KDSKLRNLQNVFLGLQYPPHMIKQQINKARHIPRDNRLQNPTGCQLQSTSETTHTHLK
ncbi:hypothetical protein JRQ81_005899, partial [Phrynocephalus forsythii]